MANRLLKWHFGVQRLQGRSIFSFALWITFIFHTITFCEADVTLSESIRLAQCRASCLEHMSRHSARHTREKPCQSNCEMCWNTCRLLQGDSPAGASLCADPSACFPGCQTACSYYRTASSSVNFNHSPRFNVQSFADLPAHMKVAHIRDDRIEWNVPKWHEPSASRPVVYVLMKKIGQSWKEIIQTIHQSTPLIPSIQTDDKLSLFVVTSLGIASFANVSRNAPPTLPVPSSTLSSLLNRKIFTQNTREDLRTDSYIANESQLLTKENGNVYKDSEYNDFGDFGDMEPPLVSIDHSWKVELTPLSVALLALVRVSWEVRGSGHDDYLVSWMEKYGVVSGHLVATETQVEISLWAGQQYVVKVELLDKHGNAVLRSGSLPIKFNSSSSEKENGPFPSTEVITSTLPPSMPSPPRGFSVSKRVKEHFGIREEHVYFPRDESLHEVLRTPKISQSYSSRDEGPPSRDFLMPRFRYIGNSKVNSNVNSNYSRRVKNVEDSLDSQKIVESEPKSSDSLVIWAVCLGVGAVIIIILIALAIRTLKKSLRKSQQQRRSEDFLSETTASSINSASTNNVPSLREEFPYETFYSASDQQIRTFIPMRHNVNVHHHPPIPYPPPAPVPIISPPHSHVHPLQHPLQHPLHSSGACSSQAHAVSSNPDSDALRIGREFLIENYILSLDPPPTFKYVINNS